MSFFPKNSSQMVRDCVHYIASQIRATGGLLDYFAKRLSAVEALPNSRLYNVLDLQLYLR